MKHLLLIISFCFLAGCTGLKKEVTRLKEENSSKTDFYQKKISELTAKISETESREAKSKTDLEIKTSEIASLKKDRTELQEELEKKERSNFGVENAVGPVKVTDNKTGISYEFNSGQGTKINNTTESVSKEKYNSVTESLSKETQRAENLTKKVSEQETTIKEKNSEIAQKDSTVTELEIKVKKLNTALAKAILEKGLPWYVWTMLGMFLLGGGQLLWKIYKPKKITS